MLPSLILSFKVVNLKISQVGIQSAPNLHNMDQHGNRLHGAYVESELSRDYMPSIVQATNCYELEDASWFEPKTYRDIEVDTAASMQHGHLFQPVVDGQPEPTASWPETSCTACDHSQWLPVTPQDNLVTSSESDTETLSPASSYVQTYTPENPTEPSQSLQLDENTSPPRSRSASFVAGSDPFELISDDYETTDDEDSDDGLTSADRSKYYKDPETEKKRRFCCTFVYPGGERCKKRYVKRRGVLYHYATIHDGTMALPRCWKCGRLLSTKYSLNNHLQVCSVETGTDQRHLV